MIDFSSLMVLYNDLSGKEIITRAEILGCGFKSHDIQNLINQAYIEKISHGKYRVVKCEKTLEEKFSRCLRLLDSTSIEEAKKLFLECYAADDKYMDRLFERILEYLSVNNYLAIFRCFELVLASGNEVYIRDVKFYLYLLNYITDIPFEFRSFIECLTYDDVEVSLDDSRYCDQNFVNRINNNRHLVFEGEELEIQIVDTKIAKKLLSQYFNARVVLVKAITRAIHGEKYSQIMELLDKKRNRVKLSPEFEAIYILAHRLNGAMNGEDIFAGSNTIGDGNNLNLIEQSSGENFEINSCIGELFDRLINFVKTSDVERKFLRCLYHLKNGSYDEACSLFLECFKENKKYLDNLLNLILDNINGGQYDDVVELLRLILAIDNKYYNRYVKFYLYLLNYLTDVPEDLKLLIINLRYEDIYIFRDSNNPAKNALIDKMRKAALSGEVFELFSGKSENSLVKITSILGECYWERFRENWKVLRAFIRGGDLQMLAYHLQLESDKRNLSRGLSLLKYLVHCLLNIELGIYPNVTSMNADNEYEAAYKGNFKLAIKLRKQRKGSKSKDDIILRYLRRINELVEQRMKREDEVKIVSCDSDSMYNEIYNYLLVGNVEDAKIVISLLPKYLETIGKSEYEFLIRELIEICCMEFDCSNTFIVPAVILFRLKSGTFQLDFNFFADKLYEALSFDRKDVALKYFDILKSLSKLGILVPDDKICNIQNVIGVFGSNNDEGNSDSEADIFTSIFDDEDDYYYGIDGIIQIRRDIETSDLGIGEYCRINNFDGETKLFIMLIFAKDYYSLGFTQAADNLVDFVKKSSSQYTRVKKALADVYKNRQFYCNRSRVVGASVIRVVRP